MDPTTLDLTSVAGIVAATIAIVHLAKAALGGVPALNRLPVALYVILVSAGLTWLAHDVLHLLDGELGALLVQAVWQAAAASGVLEWARAGSKPLAATSTSRDAVDLSKARVLLPLALIVGLGASACTGNARVPLQQADQSISAVLRNVQAGADQLLADQAITLDQRRAIAPHLLKALELSDAYNRAVRAHTPFEAIPALLDALRVLKVNLVNLLPGNLPIDLVGLVNRAIGLAPATAGGGGY